jgi:serine/threonine protein kinase
VRASIETVQRSSVVLGSQQRREQKAQVQSFRRNFKDLKPFFITRIRQLPVEHRRDTFSLSFKPFAVRFEKPELASLWQALPKLAGIVKRADIWPDYLDGYIIPEDMLEEAKRVLSQFKDAWYEANSGPGVFPSDEDRLNKFDAVPKIAMILDLTGKRRLFNRFLEEEVYDADMDYDPLKTDLLGPDADFICAQYRRTLKSDWPVDGHLHLQRHETLPLRRISSSDRRGGYSRVLKVEDLHSEPYGGRVYACKEMTAQPGAANHMKNEIQILKDLCKENHGHHLVRYVHSYCRHVNPDVIMGVLLEPYADQNLNDLLKQYCAQPSARSENRPALIRSLGCLTYSLCYLHNIKHCRHRDVKPQNILYVKKTQELMWSDFGLAYDFTLATDSKTYNENFRATRQYEAPEIQNPEAQPHGRSADVFSLGCVFLEIVSVLLLHKEANVDDIPFHQFWDYKDHIDAMERWIKDRVQETKRNADATLTKILEVCLHMINRDPQQRWKVGEITKALASLKHRNQQSPLPFCRACEEKYRVDISRHPKHPEIFKHKKRTSNTPHFTFGGIMERFSPNAISPRHSRS